MCHIQVVGLSLSLPAELSYRRAESLYHRAESSESHRHDHLLCGLILWYNFVLNIVFLCD